MSRIDRNCVAEYIQTHRDRFLAELSELLAIPSISTLSTHREDCVRCAQMVATLLKNVGFSTVEVIETSGLPVVFAELMVSKDLPTVMIYGHYDVQPPDPVELWDTPPFSPTIRGDYLHARGVSDDKGQLFCHIKAIETGLACAQSLPVNIKMVVEGEEEISSPSFGEFLSQHSDRLQSDIILVSDTPMLSEEQPSVCTSLRGILYFEITLTGPERDLHSGQNGGPAPNPIHGLAQLIAKLKTPDNRVAIPGFYKDVRPISHEMLTQLSALPINETVFAAQIGALGLTGEKDYPVLAQLWYRPTLDCNGIWGGFTGEGSKTVIPSKASAKISMRLVRDQDPSEMAALFCEFVRQHTPHPFRVEIKSFSSGAPYGIDDTHPAVEAAREAVSEAFQKEAILQGEGGSIPVIQMFAETLNTPSVLMGFNLPDDAIHAPNERFKLTRFFSGIKAALYFFEKFGNNK